MSNERMEEIESQLGVLDRIVKLGWGLLCGAFALGVWVTILEIRTQGAQEAIHRLQSDTATFKTWHYETTGNRYTSSDHVKYASENMAMHNTSDKRITRLEDNFAELKKSLDRIEQKLQTK